MGGGEIYQSSQWAEQMTGRWSWADWPSDQLVPHCREAALSLHWATNPFPPTSRHKPWPRDLTLVPDSPAHDNTAIPRREMSQLHHKGGLKKKKKRLGNRRLADHSHLGVGDVICDSVIFPDMIFPPLTSCCVYNKLLQFRGNILILCAPPLLRVLHPAPQFMHHFFLSPLLFSVSHTLHNYFISRLHLNFLVSSNRVLPSVIYACQNTTLAKLDLLFADKVVNLVCLLYGCTISALFCFFHRNHRFKIAIYSTGIEPHPIKAPLRQTNRKHIEKETWEERGMSQESDGKPSAHKC